MNYQTIQILFDKFNQNLYLVLNPYIINLAFFKESRKSFTPISFNYHNMLVYDDNVNLLNKLPNRFLEVYETYIQSNKYTKEKPLLQLVKEFGILDAIRYSLILTHGFINYFDKDVNRVIFKLINNIQLDEYDRQIYQGLDIYAYIESYIDTTLVMHKEIHIIPGIYLKGQVLIEGNVISQVKLSN